MIPDVEGRSQAIFEGDANDSQLASREPLLGDDEKARLEKIDRKFFQFANIWAERISEAADLVEMRKRAHILPSHWWWYLDEIVSSKQNVTA
jgi:hypothetical protein